MTFILTTSELAALESWRKTRANRKDAFSVRFDITGIGVRIVVINQRTQKEKDITDYEGW